MGHAVEITQSILEFGHPQALNIAVVRAVNIAEPGNIHIHKGNIFIVGRYYNCLIAALAAAGYLQAFSVIPLQ